MHELDADTAIEHRGDGRFGGTVTDRWNIGPVPNGGYVMCFGVRALGQVLPPPDPLTVTAHFLRPAVPGPVEIDTEVVKIGKNHATGQARLHQGGKDIVRITGTFGDLSAGDGPRHVTGEPPTMPPPEACTPRGDFGPKPVIGDRFDQYVDPDCLHWPHGRTGPAELRAYSRFADGRPLDTLSLILYADGMPPPAFNVMAPGWVPTVELTVHVRARPAPGWLRSRFRTRYMFGGYLDEDGEMWDDTGALVALSRQLAATPREPWGDRL